MQNYLSKHPHDKRSLFGMILGTIFWTAVLFIAAVFLNSCTSIKIKNKNISYPCCNKEVCEARRVLLTSRGYLVYHNYEDGRGYIYVGELKTK